jgi:hypothetical protein
MWKLHTTVPAASDTQASPTGSVAEMARAYGKLKKSLWADPDWLKLPGDAQRLYVYLLSQPTTDTAGVFPVQLTKWAKAASDMTVERITAAAKALHSGGWILVDHNTEEGLIHRYIADDDAGGNVFVAALRRAGLAQSSALRATLLEDILKLDRSFSEREQQLVDELADSLPDRELGAPSPVPSSTATPGAFERSPKTVQRPSEDRPKGLPSEPGENGECLKCRQGCRLGPEATEGENPMWCGDCNFAEGRTIRSGHDQLGPNA